jgi:HTH-type transcriptional regulator/antitoxin HigA
MLIKTENQYSEALGRAEVIMLKGSQNLTATEAVELKELSLAIQQYEEAVYPLPKPQSLQAMLEWKMYERRLKQKDLAKLLDEPDSRISELLTGKKAMNIRLAKKLYKVLGIPADFLLEHA